MSADQEQAFFAKVGAFIGIDPAQVARHRGRISESVFGATLLAKKGLVLDTYDGTQTSDNPTPDQEGIGVFSRSISDFSGILLAPFMDYVRKDLGYNVERPYLPLDLAVGAAWDRSSTLGGPDDLAIALAQNTDLKALVVHGYHDLMSNYLSSRYVLDQWVRAKGARERLSSKTYFGGHMFYLRAKSRAEFAADVRSFFETAP